MIKLVIAGSQDKALKFFTLSGEAVRTVNAAHGDIIRDIKEVDGVLYTASNDESVKVWTLEGEPVESLNGHQSFVYRVACRE